MVSLCQSDCQNCDGDGDEIDKNQHRNVVHDGNLQLDVAWTHLFYGSGQRALGVGPPVSSVGEE